MRVTEEELIAIYGKEKVAEAKQQFKNATIQNDLIFYHVMKNKTLCEKLLRIILKKDIRIEDAIPQSTISNYLHSKTVRLDVLATDDKHNHYDIEMQMMNNDSIPKRMRMYQSSIDIAFFAKGKKYDQANDTIIIFICKNDPIGNGLPVYTFKNLCAENPSIELKDGTIKIILVTTEWFSVQDSDLKNVLKYMNDGEQSDNFTKELDMFVSELKYDEVIINDCLSLFLRFQDEKNQGLQQGIKQGGEAEKIATTKRMKAKGFDVTLISEMTGLTLKEI